MKIKLIPGNFGNDCPGNGTHSKIECQCDECDYLLCCTEELNEQYCKECIEDCPHAGKRTKTRKRPFLIRIAEWLIKLHYCFEKM